MRRPFNKILSDDTVLLRYSVNQGEDIWTQLLFGMRYLDLRVGIVFLTKVTSLLASQLHLHASDL